MHKNKIKMTGATELLNNYNLKYKNENLIQTINN